MRRNARTLCGYWNDMAYYFDLMELQREMTDSYLYSQRFESILTFKLNNLKEL